MNMLWYDVVPVVHGASVQPLQTKLRSSRPELMHCFGQGPKKCAQAQAAEGDYVYVYAYIYVYVYAYTWEYVYV